MADAATIRELVEKVVTGVLDAGMPGLRRQIVQRVMDELQPELAASPDGQRIEDLQAAITTLEAMTAQSDVLRALLDGLAAFSGRSALFLVRGNNAVGWQARGFREDEAIKLLTLDVSQGLAAQAVQQRLWAEGTITGLPGNFISTLGAPANGNCLVAPLAIRDKVSGLIYADAGTQPNGQVDVAALQILTRAAGTWLELLALRKTTGSHPVTAVPPAAPPVSATPPPSVPAPVDESQTFSATAAEPAPAPAVVPVEAESASAPAAPAMVDDELHRKARRFAKLLVDEIKLYNSTKVAEGKLNHDLYDRLKDDIDKSRTTYDKRYAQTAVAGEDYFVQELMRNLADGNPVLLGGNFPR